MPSQTALGLNFNFQCWGLDFEGQNRPHPWRFLTLLSLTHYHWPHPPNCLHIGIQRLNTVHITIDTIFRPPGCINSHRFPLFSHPLQWWDCIVSRHIMCHFCVFTSFSSPLVVCIASINFHFFAHSQLHLHLHSAPLHTLQNLCSITRKFCFFASSTSEPLCSSLLCILCNLCLCSAWTFAEITWSSCFAHNIM